jgi:hypothetical protein
VRTNPSLGTLEGGVSNIIVDPLLQSPSFCDILVIFDYSIIFAVVCFLLFFKCVRSDTRRGKAKDEREKERERKGKATDTA